MSKHRTINRLYLTGGCILLSALFCIVYSVSTSFLYNGNGMDSSIYQVMGKGWAAGRIPYVDLWEHKGPYIFLVDALGYLICGQYGILVLQIINLSIFIFFTYKSFELYFKPLGATFFTIVSLLWLGCSYNTGNLTEEYMLPFVAAMVFYVLKQLISDIDTDTFLKDRHIPLFAGLALGIGVSTRLTNALIPCGIMLFVGGFHLFNRNWKTLFSQVFYFISGFLLIVIPFIIYFFSQGALQDLLFGSLLHNFKYFSEKAFSWMGVRKMFLTGFPFFLLVGVSFFSLVFGPKHKNRMNAGIWLCGSIPMLLWLINSKYFFNYCQTTVALFPALIYTAFSLPIKKEAIPRQLKYLSAAFIFAFSLCFSIKKLSYPVKWLDESCYEAIANDLKTLIPEGDENAFVILNGHPSIYLFADYLPCYRFFTLQDTHATRNTEIADLIREEFSSLKVKYILTAWYEQSIVNDVIAAHYRPIQEYNAVTWDKQIEQYTLFQKIE